MVITRAMVRDLFDKQQAARIFSFMILVSGLAPILAPIAGGYLAEYFSWRAIFQILGAFCFVTLVSSSLFLPETHRPTHRHISFVTTATSWAMRSLEEPSMLACSPTSPDRRSF